MYKPVPFCWPAANALEPEIETEFSPVTNYNFCGTSIPVGWLGV